MENIEQRIRELELYRVRCNEKWTNQEKRNEKTATKLHSLGNRLTVVEQRVIKWTSAAAAIGSLGGGVAFKLLG